MQNRSLFPRLQPVNQNITNPNFIFTFHNLILEFLRFIDEELTASGNDRISRQVAVTD